MSKGWNEIFLRGQFVNSGDMCALSKSVFAGEKVRRCSWEQCSVHS